jgi:hypothetical protein
MLPIRYDRHCSDCHQLRFDDKEFHGETAPHREPTIVRGFLIEKYSSKAAGGLLNTRDQEGDEGRFPAIFYTPALPSDLTERVRDKVHQAEHTLFGQEARGGCRYCHEINDPSADKIWEVLDPNIPEIWMNRSRFRHDRHTMLDCRECHAGVEKSCSTGDVLLPSIALCRNCHTAHPRPPASDTAFQAGSIGARTRCVECHVFHHADLKQEDNDSGGLEREAKPARWHGTMSSELKVRHD